MKGSTDTRVEFCEGGPFIVASGVAGPDDTPKRRGCRNAPARDLRGLAPAQEEGEPVSIGRVHQIRLTRCGGKEVELLIKDEKGITLYRAVAKGFAGATGKLNDWIGGVIVV